MHAFSCISSSWRGAKAWLAHVEGLVEGKRAVSVVPFWKCLGRLREERLGQILRH